MTRNIYDIFSSPLSGSLKKLMIEAKILELIALQVGHGIIVDEARAKRNV